MTSPARRRIAAALSAENRARLAGQAAARIIADATAQKRQAPSAVIVDGRSGAPLASVNPDGGRIEVRFPLLREALAWIHGQLVTHSPRLTGAYSHSHILLADGQPCDLDNPPDAKVYTFLSTSPYARKIEGDLKRQPESSQAPDGVYEAVAALAQHRFGNLASISFEFRSPISAYIAGGFNREGRAALRANPALVRAKRQERETRVPAIIVQRLS